MSLRQAPCENPSVSVGLLFSGPMTGTESFFSQGHGGEYLLALQDAVFPMRLGKEVREQQGQRFLRCIREFLFMNPGFALVGSEADLLDLIRLTDGYANVWVWRRDV